MYLSSRSLSSLRLRPPLDVILLVGELLPELELELEDDLDLLLVQWCSVTLCSVTVLLLCCLSMVELAEDRPETEATDVLISVGLLILSTGFLFLSLVTVSRTTIFSVSLLRSVTGLHSGTWASPIPSSSLNFPS